MWRRVDEIRCNVWTRFGLEQYRREMSSTLPRLNPSGAGRRRPASHVVGRGWHQRPAPASMFRVSWHRPWLSSLKDCSALRPVLLASHPLQVSVVWLCRRSCMRLDGGGLHRVFLTCISFPAVVSSPIRVWDVLACCAMDRGSVLPSCPSPFLFSVGV